MRTPEHDIVKLTTKEFLGNEFLILQKVSPILHTCFPLLGKRPDIICNSGEYFQEMGFKLF